MKTVIYTEKNMKLTKEEKQYIENKLMKKLDKFKKDFTCNIVAKYEKTHYVIKLKTKMRNELINVKIETYNIYKGIDALTNKFAQKVKRQHFNTYKI